eukprot:UN27277
MHLPLFHELSMGMCIEPVQDETLQLLGDESLETEEVSFLDSTSSECKVVVDVKQEVSSGTKKTKLRRGTEGYGGSRLAMLGKQSKLCSMVSLPSF